MRYLPFPFQHKFLQRTHHSAVGFQVHPFGLRNRNRSIGNFHYMIHVAMEFSTTLQNTKSFTHCWGLKEKKFPSHSAMDFSTTNTDIKSCNGIFHHKPTLDKISTMGKLQALWNTRIQLIHI